MAHEDVETLIIGAGQAGLATGYHLARAGREFLIVDAEERVGDGWRRQWDTLRLYSPARYDGLPGMPFPAPAMVLPREGRGGRLLRVVRRAVRPPGTSRPACRPPRGRRRSLSRHAR